MLALSVTSNRALEWNVQAQTRAQPTARLLSLVAIRADYGMTTTSSQTHHCEIQQKATHVATQAAKRGAKDTGEGQTSGATKAAHREHPRATHTSVSVCPPLLLCVEQQNPNAESPPRMLRDERDHAQVSTVNTSTKMQQADEPRA